MWGDDGGASFKFNFGDTDGSASDQAGAADASVEEREGEELTDLATGCSEFLGQSEEVLISPSVSLFKFRPQDVTQIITDVESINVSDLVPGKYEGGLKLWECAIDLIKFLSSKIDTGSFSLKDCKVLELGCGHGLPAIYAIYQGAKEVVFQDYNREVLLQLTAPNVRANDAVTPLPPCSTKYLAGDWSKLDEFLGKEEYDVILTSDTIYSTASQDKLYAIIKHCLKRKGGVAYAAQKSHYFGVGGSTRQFEEVVKKDGAMSIEQEELFADGSSNVREILCLRHLTDAPP